MQEKTLSWTRRLSAVITLMVSSLFLQVAIAGEGEWTALGKAPGGSVDDFLYTGDALVLSSGSKLYRSTDEGASWALISEQATNYDLSYSSDRPDFFHLLAVDPSSPDRLFTVNPDGLFVSHDGGENWALASTDFTHGDPTVTQVTAIAVSGDGSLVYVGDDAGRIHVSVDGESWSLADAQPFTGGDEEIAVQALAATPGHPTRVHASATAQSGDDSIVRSDDGGKTWQALDGSLDETCGAGNEELDIELIEIDPDDSNRIFLGGGTCSRIFRSEDGGITWTASDKLLETPWPPTDIAFDPSDPARLYAVLAAGHVFRSDDGGASWSMLEAGATGTRLHIAHADPDVLVLSAGRNGVWRSADGGGTWASSNDGFVNRRIESFARVPGTSERLIGLGGPGVVASDDGGRTWQIVTPDAGLLPYAPIAINPEDAQEIHAGGNGVYKSTDGGKTWTYDRLVHPDNDDAPSITAIMINPANPAHIVLQESDVGRVLVTRDAGEHWTWHGPDVVDDDGGAPFICAVDMAPNTPQTLFAIVEANLFKSIDGGEAWSQVDTGSQEFGGSCDIAIHPGDADTLYVAASGGVHRSEDGGQTWTWVLELGEPSPGSIAIDPQDGARMLVSHDDEIHASADGGDDWHELDMGLPVGEAWTGAPLEVAFDPVIAQRYYATRFGDGGFVYEGPIQDEAPDNNDGNDGGANDGGGGGPAGGLLLLVALPFLFRRGRVRGKR